MVRNKIFRLVDLERAIAECQSDFDRISENHRAAKKIETGLKYIETMEQLKPIVDKEKTRFKMLREKYTEEHRDELEEYNKAVRYLKANQMIPYYRREYETRCETLLKEITQTEEKFRAADLDPEFIHTIRYQVEKEIEARRFTGQRESVLAKLEQNIAKADAHVDLEFI